MVTHSSKVRELYKEINNEFSEALRDVGKEETTQIYRRNTVGNFFTLVETGLYLLKSEILEVLGSDEVNIKETPTQAEIHFLEEKNYNINKDGTVSEGELKISFKKNFLFTIKLWWKIFDIKKDIKQDKRGYDYFWKALDIRNRVTHPRHKDDFNVTENELGIIEEAHIWYSKIISLS